MLDVLGFHVLASDKANISPALVLERVFGIALYKQMILPLLDYGDLIYDGTEQYNKHTLQKLQNVALRQIVLVDRLTPRT